MSEQGTMDWLIGARLPRFDDVHTFEVWTEGRVRHVKRIGNDSTYLTPGLVVFTDCNHPMQNIICNEDRIDGWRIALPKDQ